MGIASRHLDSAVPKDAAIDSELALASGEREFHKAKLRAGGQNHFFTSAAQLTTTVSGAFGSVSTTALIRNRCPSAVTA